MCSIFSLSSCCFCNFVRLWKAHCPRCTFFEPRNVCDGTSTRSYWGNGNLPVTKCHLCSPSPINEIPLFAIAFNLFWFLYPQNLVKGAADILAFFSSCLTLEWGGYTYLTHRTWNKGERCPAIWTEATHLAFYSKVTAQSTNIKLLLLPQLLVEELQVFKVRNT